MTTPSGPYSTVIPMFPTALPQWLNSYDAQRLMAYKTYEDIYWGNPDSFRLLQRGSESRPIYIPSGRVIVNTMNRYAGKGWRPVVATAAAGEGEDAAALATREAEALAYINALFTRERFLAQYNSNKKYGLIRGDWSWYIVANPDKPQGSRLSIKAIDPAMVFPINDPDDVDRILGYDLIEQIMLGDKQVLKRQRYLKSEHVDHIGGTLKPGGPVQYQKDILEVEGAFGERPKFVRRDVPPTLLPADITNPPVYHIRNNEEPQNPFGSSEMRGLERVIGAINQTINDEDLALALAGIGVYVTDAGAPRNAQGEVQPWALHPGAVVEIGANKTFQRVQGVSTITPFQDHIAYLHDQLGRVSGASDVAQGVVDVTVAESGVALALRMAPITSEAEEKDVAIKSVHDQMLYDLLRWIKAYEAVDYTAVTVVSAFGDKLPRDNAKRFNELLQMYQAVPPLISGAYFRDACREMGYDIPEGIALEIIQEQSEMQAAADEYGARLTAEADGAQDDEEAPEEPV